MVYRTSSNVQASMKSIQDDYQKFSKTGKTHFLKRSNVKSLQNMQNLLKNHTLPTKDILLAKAVLERHIKATPNLPGISELQDSIDEHLAAGSLDMWSAKTWECDAEMKLDEPKAGSMTYQRKVQRLIEGDYNRAGATTIGTQVYESQPNEIKARLIEEVKGNGAKGDEKAIEALVERAMVMGTQHVNNQVFMQYLERPKNPDKLALKQEVQGITKFFVDDQGITIKKQTIYEQEGSLKDKSRDIAKETVVNSTARMDFKEHLTNCAEQSSPKSIPVTVKVHIDTQGSHSSDPDSMFTPLSHEKPSEDDKDSGFGDDKDLGSFSDVESESEMEMSLADKLRGAGHSAGNKTTPDLSYLNEIEVDDMPLPSEKTQASFAHSSEPLQSTLPTYAKKTVSGLNQPIKTDAELSVSELAKYFKNKADKPLTLPKDPKPSLPTNSDSITPNSQPNTVTTTGSTDQSPPDQIETLNATIESLQTKLKKMKKDNIQRVNALDSGAAHIETLQELYNQEYQTALGKTESIAHELQEIEQELYDAMHNIMQQFMAKMIEFKTQGEEVSEQQLDQLRIATEQDIRNSLENSHSDDLSLAFEEYMQDGMNQDSIKQLLENKNSMENQLIEEQAKVDHHNRHQKQMLGAMALSHDEELLDIQAGIKEENRLSKEINELQRQLRIWNAE